MAVGSRIYYPSARYDQLQNKTSLGIGCWDTTRPGAPCAFIPLPTSPSLNGKYEGNGLFPGTVSLNPVIAGVVADPSKPQAVFMYAINKLYCVDVNTGAM